MIFFSLKKETIMTYGALILQVMLAAVALTVNVVDAAIQPAMGCPTSCGNISIPFPFGTGPDCYLDDSFLVICNNTFNPPKPFLIGNIEVSNFSLKGHLKVLSRMAYDCYDDSGFTINDYYTQLRLENFSISAAYNIFTAVGCDTYAFVEGSKDKNYTTGCTAFCDQLERAENGTCSGIGCCQTSFPEDVKEILVTVNSYRNHSRVMDFNPCGYAFVAEKGYYNFSSTDLIDLQHKTNDSFPVVLDWAVGNLTCEEARKDMSSFACRSVYSECHNSFTRGGYHCSCSPGFQGNPYLIDGCEDIKECETLDPCVGICTETPGNYSCSCPKGFEGDGQKGGTGCRRKQQTKMAILRYVALGVIFSIALLVAGSSWIYCILRGRKLSKMKEKFFKQNGGLLLQQKLSKQDGPMRRDITFTEEDLKKATNNYDESKILGQGGFGTVYKGALPDNRVVAIKKSKVSDQSQIEQFINEVIILSQINHRNVVKLIGCCLETEVPLLVYEFITNGTLYSHIHDEHLSSLFTWDLRLKIATETAGALAYLHSATSVPIIHRDIKTVNILLDDSYTTKVSDFGASRFIPTDKIQLTTLVQGTLGYLDPEYFHSSQITEKSDVYSFGVVLAELLTAEKALSFTRPENDRNLATYFVSLIEQDKLFNIIDKRLVEGKNVQQLKEVATLAKRCLNVKSGERPTMKEVAVELEGLKFLKRHPWINESDLYPEEMETLLDLSASHSSWDGFIDAGSCSNATSTYESLKDQIIVQLPDGR